MDDNESKTYALKYLCQNAFVIFISLSNYIYIHIQNDDIENLHRIVTETKTFQSLGNSEILTGVPNF